MTKRKTTWNQSDFPNMSWHDNHVHGLQIVEGADGAGELILDIDHILEWLQPSEGTFAFRVAPATLTFHQVMGLRVEIDYASATAGIVPPSIDEIVREESRWTIRIGWPHGQIVFSGNGFTQVLRGTPVVYDHQCLEPQERE